MLNIKERGTVADGSLMRNNRDQSPEDPTQTTFPLHHSTVQSLHGEWKASSSSPNIKFPYPWNYSVSPIWFYCRINLDSGPGELQGVCLLLGLAQQLVSYSSWLRRSFRSSGFLGLEVAVLKGIVHPFFKNVLLFHPKVVRRTVLMVLSPHGSSCTGWVQC